MATAWPPPPVGDKPSRTTTGGWHTAFVTHPRTSHSSLFVVVVVGLLLGAVAVAGPSGTATADVGGAQFAFAVPILFQLK